ncbi:MULTISPECIES: ABC transporter permease [Nesterenkonia]|uniref:Iron complex transport system permease protein n=1 Tax=Nesterenkonia xinjiangensis TaxID=225327 RepID=A0A7Z0GJU5_9MICC|nr:MULTISPECIES: iron chelate uptake ABC transporter family permease subunit [Nesterenkonia]MDZ5076595.1 iron chelate uptake ABC transporter family permease subunit [Nesterenkonia sp. HG001]NYJ77336.1 iron complex transport system permease protein [Nesterenkonia xinjiangensis]
MTTTLRQDIAHTSRDILVDAERSRRRPLWTPAFSLAVVVTLGLLVLSLLVGQFDVFADGNFWMFGITRIPRTVALVLAGASMAMCGVIMQLLTQNRFVEPTTTGTTEWAGLGLILVMWLAPTASLFVRMSAAVGMAFLGTMVFFLFLRRVSLKSSLIVPIIGIMLGAVVSSFSTYLALMTDSLQTLAIWFQGSFTGVIQGRYELMWIVLGVTVLVFLVADQFTAAGLGKDMATNVGLNYALVLFMGTAMVAVATGVTATVVGTLPFLGLVVPNIVALFRGDDLRSNLPWVCLVGISTVTVCDLVGRLIIAPFEIPVSMVLGLVGGVVFIGLLLRQRRKGGLVT